MQVRRALEILTGEAKYTFSRFVFFQEEKKPAKIYLELNNQDCLQPLNEFEKREREAYAKAGLKRRVEITAGWQRGDEVLGPSFFWRSKICSTLVTDHALMPIGCDD
jgi:hypothetical protein